MSSEGRGARRFEPQLVEESTESTSSRKHRRFSPEPISTSTRSSRKTPPASQGPALVESEHGKAEEQESQNATTKPRRKFVAEPVEVSSRSNRNEVPKDAASSSVLSQQEDSAVADQNTQPTPKPRRKFAPQLVETATRRRRSTDEAPALQPSDRTDASLEDPLRKAARPSLNPLPPANTPVGSQYETAQLKPPPVRQGSMKPHNNTRINTRQHSFKVPELPDIDSSESDVSNARSLSPRQGGESDTSDEAHHRDKVRRRESEDGDVSGYLLALAAKTAEKQLREQEAAAFPNTQFHEHVAHYVNRSDSDESSKVVRSKPGRAREQSVDGKEELRRMQEHAKRLNGQPTKGQKAPGTAGPPKTLNRNEASGLAGDRPISLVDGTPRRYIGGYQRDPDIKQMRKAASPPMLGEDIDFPRCASPEFARFDVTQGADYLRKNMCYLSEQAEGQDGLWNQQPEQALAKSRPGTPSRVTPGTDAQGDKASRGAKGLWGGLCNAKDENQGLAPTGLMTPRRTPLATPAVTPVNEREDPFGGAPSLTMEANAPAPPRAATPRLLTPPASTPPRKDTGKQKQAPNMQQAITAAIDSRLKIEAQLDAEFHDAFVTQVYNYLSFGYPALGRKFDEELSRVAKVSVEELREDDKLAEPRGFVRLGNDEVDGARHGIEETSCKRWMALHKYVREWGRQMLITEMEQGGPWGMRGYDPHRAGGFPAARRGSWGH